VERCEVEGWDVEGGMWRVGCGGWDVEGGMWRRVMRSGGMRDVG
jgi:hypothetical protein